MTSPPKESRKVLEGIFGINKPQWASSAGVLRDLQEHFAKSSLFTPWLDSQRRVMTLSSSKKRHIDNLKVKLGHGGTLDPMATGVLIVGVGKGTKCLQRFLECTKTYECVVLFGAATDSYDAVGKVVSKAPYEHVTKELVEEKLAQFRGKIMQKPSIFSALKVDGKKMYEYAREGKDIPEVAARPVEVLELEMVEWLEPGTHEYKWPKEEADAEEREGAEKLLGIRKEDAAQHFKMAVNRSRKRSRTPEGDCVANAGEQPKRPRTDSEPAMSGALPVEDGPQEAAQNGEHSAAEASPPAEDLPAEAVQPPVPTEEQPAETVAEAARIDKNTEPSEPTESSQTADAPSPPAARIRMTVTSGFYVRSFSHDLGLACSSLGMMSSLIRSRQGDYTVGQNVLEYTDIVTPSPEVDAPNADSDEAMPDAGELKPWEVQMQKELEGFMEKEGWEAEEVEDEESWKASRGEMMKGRREEGRYASYRGDGAKKWGKGGKGGWKGKGKGNTYSRSMNGGGGGGGGRDG